MEIITSIPRYSDGEVNRALMREITTGIALKEAWENEREKICAQEVQNIKDTQKARDGMLELEKLRTENIELQSALNKGG